MSAPSTGDALRDWAKLVAPLELIERKLHITSKAETLAGVIDHPLERVIAAVELARSEMAEADLSAAGDAPARGPAAPPEAAIPDGFFVDWEAFWAAEDEAEWLYPGILARGRGHALYASGKTGKSLLALWLAWQMATGPEPVVVLYLDYEMCRQDVRDRLLSMGVDESADLGRLRYALLPRIAGLDVQAGADELEAIVMATEKEFPDHHILVVLDTIDRAVRGPENDSDTYRQFFARTGIMLKQHGATLLRLDHSGHDTERQKTGPRGSAAKNDDVDVVWRMQHTLHGVKLTLTAGRMSWLPAAVTLRLHTDPVVRYVRLTEDWPDGTLDVVELLDELALDIDTGVDEAAKALRGAGEGRRLTIVSAAVKYRRERDAETRAETRETEAGNAAGNAGNATPEQGRETEPETRETEAGNARETRETLPSTEVGKREGVFLRTPSVSHPSARNADDHLSAADLETLCKAASIACEAGAASVSLLRRRMNVDNVAAAELLERMAAAGVVAPGANGKYRSILVNDRDRALSMVIKRFTAAGAAP